MINEKADDLAFNPFQIDYKRGVVAHTRKPSREEKQINPSGSASGSILGVELALNRRFAELLTHVY
jgi:hypothetical protein